jgi:hypothetical protein
MEGFGWGWNDDYDEFEEGGGLGERYEFFFLGRWCNQFQTGEKGFECC